MESDNTNSTRHRLPQDAHSHHPHSKSDLCVPSVALVSVEHPFVVQDLAKMIHSLGGDEKLKRMIHSEDISQPIELFLRPADVTTKSIPSAVLSTNNLLLRIAVPKRTGRKRKRDSNTTFSSTVREDDEVDKSKSLKSPSRLLRMMKDNPDRIEVEPVGNIEQTHRFRTMPDFVYSTQSQTFMEKMRATILTHDLDKARHFRIDEDHVVDHETEIIPPPSLTQQSIPFNYSYHQNPFVKSTVDDLGHVTTVNESAPRTTSTLHVTHDCTSVPSKPANNLPAIHTLHPTMQQAIEKVRELFEERPIWTRRALNNQLQDVDLNLSGKHILPHVSYIFRSGPWREGFVKIGVDPRSDPKYRVYQTLMFQFDKESARRHRQRGGDRRSAMFVEKAARDHGLGNKSHIFDGARVGLDGKVWQVCDITDPFLTAMLNTSVRELCHIQNDGWYHNGTWSKLKILTKYKMSQVLSGDNIGVDAQLARLAAFPDIIDESSKADLQLRATDASDLEIQLAALIRTAASSAVPEGPRPDMVSERQRGEQASYDGFLQAHHDTSKDGEGHREAVDGREDGNALSEEESASSATDTEESSDEGAEHSAKESEPEG